MKKVVFLLVLLFVTSVNAIEIKSNNAVLYNLNDDEIIYEKNSSDNVQIASLTKIITAITVIENIDDLDQYVSIKYEMLTGLDGYAKIGLKVGDKLTYRELLYLLILNSAADAGQALAYSVAGSIDEFSVLMNDTIKKIGVKNSKFDNPVGIDSESNYSTASDLALILKYCLKNKEFKNIFEANEYYIKSIDVKAQKTLRKTASQYNINTDMISGSKTGFTYEAGMCLASIASIDGVDYLLITTGAPTDYPYHITDAVDLYNYYSTNYGYIKILSIDQEITKLKIKNGKEEYYYIKATNDYSKYLRKDINLDDIKYEYDGIDEINKKIHKGDKLGIVNVVYESDILYSFDVYLNDDIEYKTELIVYIIVGFAILFVLMILFKLIKKIANK